MIDRVGPTRQPRRTVRGYQKWRCLLFMHWAVPVETLRPLVPRQLELDLCEGVAYVGVVPFAMQEVRPSWLPRRLSFRFLETNVRTYVRHKDQPGVYFFSLDAASRVAVCAARTFWKLPYHHADMRLDRDGDEIVYLTRRRGSGERHWVHYRIARWLGASRPGTLEFFLLERYLLFVDRQQEILVGQVHHAPYPVQETVILGVEDELIEAAGVQGSRGRPLLAHYAAGVDVKVYGLTRS